MSEFKKTLIKNGIVLLAIVAVLSAFLVLFKLNINHQVQIIRDLQSRKHSLSQSAENLSLLIKDWEVAKNYKEKISLLVPSKDNLVALAKDFQKVAEEKKVRLSFNFGKESNPQSSQVLGSVGFTAVIEGSSSNVLQFLEEIESQY